MKKGRIILFLVLALMPFSSYAGAWINPAGETIVIHNLTYSQYNKFKDKNGNTLDRPRFVKYEYNPYIEYGINEDWGAGFSPSFQHVEGKYRTLTESGTDTNDAFTGVTVFVKRKITEIKGFVFSVIPTVELPGMYNKETSPFFGKKDSFWGAFLSVGKGLYAVEKNYGYINVEAGVKSLFSESFTGDSGSSFKASINSGLPITGSQTINLGINYTKSVSGYSAATSFLNRYGYDSTELSISDLYKWHDLNFEIGYIQQVDARNAGIGEGIKLSIWHKF